MKKSLLLLMLICALALSGCARRPIVLPRAQNTGRRAAPAILDDLPSGGHPLQIGGVVVTPPLSLDEAQALGFNVDVDDRMLDGQTLSDLYDVTGDGFEFYTCFYNQADRALPVKDCPMVLVWATDFVADKGVAPGMTDKELLTACGDAADETFEDGSRWLTYGTGLYDGLMFELDTQTRRVISALSFCLPADDVEAAP